jgi:hypothetical protein
MRSMPPDGTARRRPLTGAPEAEAGAALQHQLSAVRERNYRAWLQDLQRLPQRLPNGPAGGSPDACQASFLAPVPHPFGDGHQLVSRLRAHRVAQERCPC